MFGSQVRCESSAIGAASRRRRSQAGFTLVEILVVITIIGLIMALVGPRVLNYLGESKAKAAKIQIESFSSALDLYYLDLGRYPEQQRRPRRADARQQRARLERALFARRRGAQRSLGPWLCLPLAGRARALRHHFAWLRRSGRRQWNGSRHRQRHALRRADARGEAGFRADRDPLRARHHRPARGDHPAGDSARDLARQARELCGRRPRRC